MEFIDSWHFYELERACLKAHEMAHSVEEDVYSVVYATEPHTIPPAFRISQLTLITNRPAAAHCAKLVLIIAHKRHIHHMFNLYFRIYPDHRNFMKVVDNWEEALTVIRQDKNEHKIDFSKYTADAWIR